MPFNWIAASSAADAYQRNQAAQAIEAERKQRMNMQALNLEQARQQTAQNQRVREAQSLVLPGMMQGQQPTGQPPQGPQPPNPGQASVPAAPPQAPQFLQTGANGPTGVPLPPSTGQMAQPAKAAPVQIPPYQTVDGAAQLLRTMSQPQAAGPISPPSVDQASTVTAGPPTGEQVAAKVFSPQQVIQQLNAQGVPPDLWLPTLESMKPIFDMQGQEQLRQLKVEKEAREAAEDAYHRVRDEQKFAEDVRHHRAMERKGTGTGVAIPASGPQSTEDFYKVASRFGMTTDAFEKAVDNYNINGTLPTNARNQKSMPLQIAIQNRAAEKYPDSLPAANKVELSAYQTALKNTVNREAAVNRLTGSVKKLQDRAMELTKKINARFGGQAANQTINDLVAKFGNNGDIAELRNLMFAVGREYMEATTMPGSNAQMHISSQEEAQKMANGNMPPAMLAGALRGINTDIAASESALSDEEERLKGKIKGINQPSSGSSSGSTNLPQKNAKGWTLKVDAKGNKAYVSPDGKQFEEVK